MPRSALQEPAGAAFSGGPLDTRRRGKRMGAACAHLRMLHCAFASQIFVSLRAMANHNDLADLIAAHRRAADRVFESEMVKLRLTFGQGHR